MMMGLRDLVSKKSERVARGLEEDNEDNEAARGPDVVFIRSDTLSHEVVHPPGFGRQADCSPCSSPSSSPSSSGKRQDDAASVKRRSTSGSGASQTSRRCSSTTATANTTVPATTPRRSKAPALRRLSQRLRLPSRAAAADLSHSSHKAPNDDDDDDDDDDLPAAGATESQWERRATLLASRAESPCGPPATPTTTTTRQTDRDVQQAIALHEAGRLDESTRLFARLADAEGANNALSQVLYGLALRHGWGCPPDPNTAVRYLSAAASNAAAIEKSALEAGLDKGGAAKGELVLAIFELANCFRNGWGVPQDARAAKQYYETAANLGDTDAMNEVAWCYLHGFGCKKKDKHAAARYYRLAEQAGSKTLGNSWIWKEKYDASPPSRK